MSKICFSLQLASVNRERDRYVTHIAAKATATAPPAAPPFLRIDTVPKFAERQRLLLLLVSASMLWLRLQFSFILQQLSNYLIRFRMVPSRFIFPGLVQESFFVSIYVFFGFCPPFFFCSNFLFNYSCKKEHWYIVISWTEFMAHKKKSFYFLSDTSLFLIVFIDSKLNYSFFSLFFFV